MVGATVPDYPPGKDCAAWFRGQVGRFRLQEKGVPKNFRDTFRDTFFKLEIISFNYRILEAISMPAPGTKGN